MSARSLTPDDTILGLLAAEARHGYHLLDCFRDPAQLGDVWALGVSQVYAVLKRLEQQALIAGQTVVPADAPPRTEYALTAAGAQRLDRWLHTEQPGASVRAVRVEFLSRLYIARLLNIPTQPIVRRQRAACQQQLAELVALRDRAEPGVSLLARELLIAQTEAILRWLDRCEMPAPEDVEPFTDQGEHLP